MCDVCVGRGAWVVWCGVWGGGLGDASERIAIIFNIGYGRWGVGLQQISDRNILDGGWRWLRVPVSIANIFSIVYPLFLLHKYIQSFYTALICVCRATRKRNSLDRE